MSEENTQDPSPHPDKPSDLDTNIALTTALAAIKSSPQVAAKFASQLLENPEISGIVYRTRPKGPYYNKENALQLKPILDRMMENKLPKSFSCKKFNVSVGTLYNRIAQSFQYLVENQEIRQLHGMKYYDFKELVCLHREDQGTDDPKVVIRFKGDKLAENALKDLSADDLVETPGGNEWKLEMDKWLASDDTTTFEKKNLNLTDEQVNDLDYSLSMVEGIMATVEKNRIKIVKYQAR